jgi:hypothetical protein
MAQQVPTKSVCNMINTHDMVQYFWTSYHSRRTEGDKLLYVCQL